MLFSIFYEQQAEHDRQDNVNIRLLAKNVDYSDVFHNGDKNQPDYTLVYILHQKFVGETSSFFGQTP
jgi:hypothetical protein